MTDPILKKRLNYLRSCYQADSREINLDRIGLFTQSTTIEFIHFLEGEEFLARGTLPSTPLSPDIGKQIDINTHLYARELQLLYGVFFISGVLPAQNRVIAEEIDETDDDNKDDGSKRTASPFKKKKSNPLICEPLLYYEAFQEINEQDQSCLLHIDIAQPLINRQLLRRILKNSDPGILSSIPLPAPYINDIYLADLLKWLKQHCVLDETLDATQFPLLESNIQKIQAPTKNKKRASTAKLQVFSSAAVMMVQRGSSSRGIARELQLLAQQDHYSQALLQLLGQQNQLDFDFDYHRLSTKALYEKLRYMQSTAPDACEIFELANFIAQRISHGFESNIPSAHVTEYISLITSFLLNTSGELQNSVPLWLQQQIHLAINSNLLPTSLHTPTDVPQNIDEKSNSKPYALPAVLSNPQIQALKNAATQPLSLISGPPGTGKSYTLAALALDRYLNNESVLIVTRTEQAASVIANKLRYDMGMTQGIVNLGGEKSLFTALKKQLTEILRGQKPNSANLNAQEYLDTLKNLVQQEQALREQFAQRSQFAFRASQYLVRYEQNQLSWWQRWFRVPSTKRAIRNNIRHWKLLEQFNICQQRREQISTLFLNAHRSSAIQQLLQQSRTTFTNYRSALDHQELHLQAKYFDRIDLSLLLKALPIWIVTLDDLHRALPFRHELFDLLVVDEATQCDIPSALPAFNRCKRAIISGDSQQLRHISFLSRQQEMRLYAQADLNMREYDQWSYRSNSLLDLVTQQIQDQQAVTFLDEHFRSRPELIRFSNKQFYNNRIKVMKERPEIDEAHPANPPALILERISGSRSDFKINKAEIERVIQIIQAHIQQYAHIRKKPSIGVLSPFRAQVNELRTQIAWNFTRTQIADFNILVATPYGFQGEERDLMILSFAIDNNSRQAGIYLNRPDVFNVAITRAREQQYILFSGGSNALPINNLFRYYLQDIENKRITTLQHDVPISVFQQQIIDALTPYNIHTWTHYPIAGQLVDLICYRNGKMLAIDLIGYPGLGEEYSSLERYQILARAGLNMLPLSYGIWTVERNSALQAILERLP